MGLRHDAREWALQFLFQSEFNQDASLDKAFSLFWQFQDEWAAASPSEAAASAKDPADSAHAAKGRAKARRFAEELARGVIAHHKEIDPLIEKYAENWEIDRMGIVDRNVMRIAVYEMLHRDDIPPVVSINEAVDLAKAFSSVESGKFVNGILDRVRMGLDRPARDAIDERKVPAASPSRAPADTPEPPSAPSGEPAP